jgi:S1-C subfamily serine protease
MRIHLPFLVTLLCVVSCSTATVQQIPEPLPETLRWTRPALEGAFLGLKTQENDSGSLDSLFFDPGVRVARVVENSPAALAGFKVGDVLLGFDGHEVNDPGALTSLVAAAGVASPVTLQVRRGDSVFELVVTLQGAETEGDFSALLYRVDATRSRAGWLSVPGGARLVSLAENGPAAIAGLEVGALVTAVNGREVLSARSLIRELERHAPGAEVAFSVRGPDGPRVVSVELLDSTQRVTGVSLPVLFSYSADADGSQAKFVFIDLYFFSLFQYTRTGAEREYSLLSVIDFSTGIGELGE